MDSRPRIRNRGPGARRPVVDSQHERRPRSTLFLALGLLLICIGLSIFLATNLVKSDGSKSNWRMLIASVFARAFVDFVADTAVSMEQ